MVTLQTTISGKSASDVESLRKRQKRLHEKSSADTSLALCLAQEGLDLNLEKIKCGPANTPKKTGTHFTPSTPSTPSQLVRGKKRKSDIVATPDQASQTSQTPKRVKKTPEVVEITEYEEPQVGYTKWLKEAKEKHYMGYACISPYLIRSPFPTTEDREVDQQQVTRIANEILQHNPYGTPLLFSIAIVGTPEQIEGFKAAWNNRGEDMENRKEAINAFLDERDENGERVNNIAYTQGCEHGRQAHLRVRDNLDEEEFEERKYLHSRLMEFFFFTLTPNGQLSDHTRSMLVAVSNCSNRVASLHKKLEIRDFLLQLRKRYEVWHANLNGNPATPADKKRLAKNFADIGSLGGLDYAKTLAVYAKLKNPELWKAIWDLFKADPSCEYRANSSAPLTGMNKKWNKVRISDERKIAVLTELRQKIIPLKLMKKTWEFEFNKAAWLHKWEVLIFSFSLLKL